MKFRGLIIAVVVLLALSGLLYWSNHRKPAEQSAAVPANSSPTVLKMDREAIAQIELTRKGARPVTLDKGAGDAWRITEPKPLDANQDVVSEILSTVSNLNADRIVEDKASDLKQYGLDQPTVMAAITDKNHGQRELLLGDDTPAGGDAYAMVQGDPRVYTISSYQKSSIDKGLDDLRNKKLFDFGSQEPNKIELRDGAKSWIFLRNGNDWSSNGKKVDSSGVESLIEKIRDLTATSFPESGFTSPELDATVESEDGRRVEKVQISKSAGGCIARREKDPSLYQLDSSVLEQLTSAAGSVKPAGAAK